MKASPKMRAHLAAYRVKGHAIAQAQEAAKEARPKTSWWIGLTREQFAQQHAERVKVLTAVSTNYTQPWGLV